MSRRSEMTTSSMRDRFIATADDLLSENDDIVMVLADIGVSQFRDAGVLEKHPERIVNVGIREQLQVSFAAGLAKEGFSPIIHTYAPFLVERPFEQIKLDFGHQGLAGVFVSVGASYDSASSGRTHQAPEDVALLNTLPAFSIFVPGHADEAEVLLRHAVGLSESVYLRLSEESNAGNRPVEPGKMLIERRGSENAPVILAIGPRLEDALEATVDLDVTVLYATTVRPFDTDTLSKFATNEVVVIEPYLEGTTVSELSPALQDRPHRLLSIGVKRKELRNYGTIADHNRAHGLDADGMRDRINEFLRS